MKTSPRDIIAGLFLIGYFAISIVGLQPSETLDTLLVIVLAYYGFRRATNE